VGFDYTIWILAFLLYVGDAARLLSPRQLLLVEAGRGRLVPNFSEHTFTTVGRSVVFGPVLMPYRGVFVAAWSTAWRDAAGLQAALATIEELRRPLAVIRPLVSLVFVLLFVAGPVLTWALGSGVAVLATAALLYPTIVVTIAALWWKRRALRLTAARSAWLSVEMLICPAFLPNLVRKITAVAPIEADGAQILAATAPAEVREEFLARLAVRTEALIDEAGDDDASRDQLRAYLATVQAAR
jgi:hypothetical protein